LGEAAPGELTATRGNEIGQCPGLYNWACLITSNIADNSFYKLILKDVAGGALNGEGYDIKLGLAPLPTSSLTRAMFGTIGQVTIDGQALKPAAFTPNKSLQVNFTLPAQRFGSSLQVQATGITGLPYFRIEKPLLADASSVVIGWTAPENNVTVSALHFRLCTYDLSGRKFVTTYTVPVR
jgi:hypothetical protein